MHSSVLTLLPRRGFSLAALCLAVVWLASCTSSKTANHLAATTISELAAYEKSVEDKINAEKGFYREQSAKLIELQGYSVLPKVPAAQAVPQQPSGETAKSDPAADRIRSSLPYLRITTASERDAVVAIDKILGQGTPTARSAFMSYISDGVVSDGAQVEQAVQSRQLLDASVTANLANLDSGKSNLATAREALTQTIQKKSFFARLKDALSFGKDARDLYEAKQTKQTKAKPKA